MNAISIRDKILAFKAKTKFHRGNRPASIPKESTMRRCLVFAIAITLFSLTFHTTAQQGKDPVRKTTGLEKRVPWTTSKVIGSPEPPPPYKTELAFAKLPKYDEPLDMTYAPGTNRLFIAERWGKIFSFINKKDADKADLALELKDKDSKKQMIYAFTFHPKFKENGYVFVTWIPDGSKEGLPKGSRVSRFTMKGEPPIVERESPVVERESPVAEIRRCSRPCRSSDNHGENT